MARKWLGYGMVGLFFGTGLSAIAVMVATVASPTIAARVEGETAVQKTATQLATSPPEQEFIVMMMPYQQDAIALADLALTRARRAEVKALAQTIKANQNQKNRQLRTWYQAWYGGTVPDSLQWQQARKMVPVSVGGAMTVDVSQLETAADFDRVFLEEMMAHYQMGVLMAQTLLSDSDRPEIRTLANAIIQTQSAKIDEMQYWYQEWYVEGL